MTLRSLGLAVLGLGYAIGPALAQNPTEGQGQPPRQRGLRSGAPDGQRGPRRMSIDQQMERLTKDLNLTADQQEKIRKLLTDHREKMMEQFRTRGEQNREQMRELRAQLDAARQANDNEKVREIETKMRELWGGGSQMADVRQELIRDIEAVLTPEQKEPFEKLQDELFPWRGGSVPLESDPGLLMRAVHSLNLSQDKAQKMRELFREWRTKSQDLQSAEEKKAAAADLYKQVVAQLTPEEQAKLKEYRPEASRGSRPTEQRDRQGRGRRGQGPPGSETGGSPAAPQQ